MNHSTGHSESSPGGFRPPTPPRLHVVEMNAGDAIASIAISLIDYVLRSDIQQRHFLDWFNAHTNGPELTYRDLMEDLTKVRDVLREMGYDYP